MWSCSSRKGWLLILACWCLTPAFAIAQVDAENIPASGGLSHFSSGREWEARGRYSDIREYNERPEDEVLQSIAVEWLPFEQDALGNYLFIRGRLTVPDGESGTRRPIDWLQGFTVLVAESPNARLDWSRGISHDVAELEFAVARPSGEFLARVDLRNMQRDREQEQVYQFGIALAAHSSPEPSVEEIVHSSRDRAILQSVQMLTVPAAPELPEELVLIDRASRWQVGEDNALQLIRAVNALHALGKEQALARLREYLVLTRSESLHMPYFYEQPVVASIARILFEPIELETPVPALYGGGQYSDDERDAHYDNWPLYPLAVSHDIPFTIKVFYELGEQGYEIPLYLDWVERHCVLRDEPLFPSVNPLVAAEMILQSPQMNSLEGYDRSNAEQRLREDALAMVEGLLPPIDFPRGSFGFWAPEQIIQWHDRVEQSIELGITWDEERQEFVVPETQ